MPEPIDNKPLDRAAISRLNGAKSHGPVTPEGKKRSARNSVRHGLLAKLSTLTTEDREAFLVLLDEYIERLQPADMVEMRLVERIALAADRLERLAPMEVALFDLEMDLREKEVDEKFVKIDHIARLAYAFKSLADNSKSLALFLRYHTSMTREYDRAMNQLVNLRKNFPVPSPSPEAELPNEPSSDPNPMKTSVEQPPEGPPAMTPYNPQATEGSVPQPTSERSQRPPARLAS